MENHGYSCFFEKNHENLIYADINKAIKKINMKAKTIYMLPIFLICMLFQH